MHAHHERLARVRHVGVSGADDNDRLRLHLESAAGDSKADVVPLHVQVGDHAVEVVPVLHDLQGLGTAVRRRDGVAFVFEDHLQRAGHVDFVIDYQQ